MSEKALGTLPNFFIIGAGKSGTTSLDMYLNQHPDIFLPEVKEPNYFAYAHRTIDEFKDQETILHYETSITNYEDYLGLFATANVQKRIGDVSNTYMYMPGVLDNIQSTVPNAKYLAILRQPAERLFSRYMHLVRVDKQPDGSFEDLFDRNSIWWERADLVKEGFYYRNLKTYFDAVPRADIKILLHEDLLQNRDETLASICEFLEVDPGFSFKATTIYNKSGTIKNQTLNKLIGNNSILIKRMRAIAPGIYQTIRNNAKFKDRIENMRNKNVQKQKLDKQLKQKITRELYSEDIDNLSKLIDRDLSHWL